MIIGRYSNQSSQGNLPFCCTTNLCVPNHLPTCNNVSWDGDVGCDVMWEVGSGKWDVRIWTADGGEEEEEEGGDGKP